MYERTSDPLRRAGVLAYKKHQQPKSKRRMVGRPVHPGWVCYSPNEYPPTQEGRDPSYRHLFPILRTSSPQRLYRLFGKHPAPRRTARPRNPLLSRKTTLSYIIANGLTTPTGYATREKQAS